MYADIAVNADKYFHEISRPYCTIFDIELSDQLLQLFVKCPADEELVSANSKELTKLELDALQYLAGYTVQKFIRKYRNSSNYKSCQNVISVLERMGTDCIEQTLYRDTNKR